MNEEFISPKEVRRVLGISTATYYRWLREGKLRGVRVGKNRRFSRQEVDDLLRTGGSEFREAQDALDEALEIYGGLLKLEGKKMPKKKNREKAGELAKRILRHAHKNGAVSVHIEPGKVDLSVRERIGGVLTPVKRKLPLAAARDVVRAFKENAGLNVEDEKRPTHGRYFTEVGGKRLDVFVSTFPTGLGESVTLRILDPSKYSVDLEKLGYPAVISKRIRELLTCPRGVIIVNGPVESGKSTTLYALLALLRSPDRKIMTAEDPVEFFLEGIQQADVGGEDGIGFVEAFRAMMRNDVDVAMLSEVRDGETMKMLFGAGGTGHLVLSALHAQDAVGAINRILEVGDVSRNLVAENLLCVLNQRLVRRACSACRVMQPISKENERRLGIKGKVAQNTGCGECRNAGRRVVGELLEATPEVRQAIETGADLRSVLPKGPTLRELLTGLVLKGEVTAEEMVRVLALESA